MAVAPAVDLPVVALGLAQVVVLDGDNGTGPVGAQPIPVEQPQEAEVMEQGDVVAAQPLWGVPPAALSMAQVIATMEVALQGLHEQ